MTDARFMKKKVTTGEIEADLDNMCINVHYDVEVTALAEDERALMSEKKHDVKRIRLQSLNENSNITQLAQQIVEKCKLIHPSKLPLIEQLLVQLKERKLQDDRAVYFKPKEGNGAVLKHQQPVIEEVNGEKPSLQKLETYVEMLYEGREKKLQSIQSVLALARNQDNLEELAGDDALFGALSRLLREDSKDIDITINIVYTFFCFSNFSQFHPFISQNRVGDTCTRIIEDELERYEQAKVDLQAVQGKKDAPAAQLKFEELKAKQEILLSVCAHLLLNLAEDVAVERKMKKRNITTHLCQLLDWAHPELLIVVLTFLKKLSIFKENKNEMVQCNCSAKVTKFVPNDNEALLTPALKLLLNLSFDTAAQQQMVEAGLIPKLVNLVLDENTKTIALKLLYQLSINDKWKGHFTGTDAIPLILKLILETPADQFISKELIALAINLMGNQSNAETMLDEDGLKMLMHRVKKTRDPLLMKMLRAAATHEGKCQEQFLNHVADLVGLVQKAKNNDFLVEVLGTMGALSSDKFKWATILIENELIEPLAQHLVPGYSEDDIALEVIILYGTCCVDRESSKVLVASSVIPKLVQLLLHKQEDDEIVLQTIYAFFRLMQHKDSRHYIFTQTQVVTYLMDLLFDKNPEIRKMASSTLDIVMEYDIELAKKIRKKRFEAHNAAWVELVAGDDARNGGAEDDDFDSRYYEDDAAGAAGTSSFPWQNLHVYGED